MPPIGVVIAGRAKADRAAWRSLLDPEKDIRVVAEARSALDAVSATERLKPGILLLDLALFDGDGTSFLRVIRQESPWTQVLLLTHQALEARTLEVLCRGARGYLEKRTLRTYLARAIRAVDAGEAWVPRKMVAKLMDRLVRLSSSD